MAAQKISYEELMARINNLIVRVEAMEDFYRKLIEVLNPEKEDQTTVKG